MPQYLTPGVYVEEVMEGTRPIEGVGTQVAALIGFADKPGAPIGVPTAVNNWTQYTNIFAGDGPSTDLTLAVHGFFLNGGQRCYVLNIGKDGSVGGTSSQPGIATLDAIDEIAIVAFPGGTDAVSLEAVISHCEGMRDRVAVLDFPSGITDLNTLTRPAMVSGETSSSSSASGSSTSASSAASGSSSGEGESGAEGESDAESADETPPPPAPTGRRGGPGAPSEVGNASRETDWAAQYGPYIWIVDPITGKLALAPPSGHVAGVWARVDGSRGVHKAPANEIVRGAVGLEYLLTASEQGLLNSSGINAIRNISGGIRIWGARTRAGSDSLWKYVPVRRLFAFAEESIQQGTNWVVFEPNDRMIWNLLARDVKAFLRRLWSDGALFGATEREAFFVKCDAETNPPENIDAGILTALVGMAPVKPAEFIVFKVSQYVAGSAGGEEA